MKLAEALKLRADLNTRMSRLRNRLVVNSKVQEGDSPSEDPEELLAELEEVSGQLEELIWRINTTNCSTVDAEGRTLTQLIARRDVLIQRESIMRDLLNSASNRVDRYSRNEIAVHSTVDVREIDLLMLRLGFLFALKLNLGTLIGAICGIVITR